MIQVNEENICKGPWLKKGASQKKKSEPCDKRFCSDCLSRKFTDSWKKRLQNPDSWICPVCMDICTCNQCQRKRNKSHPEAMFKQVDIPFVKGKLKKREEKMKEKEVVKGKKGMDVGK